MAADVTVLFVVRKKCTNEKEFGGQIGLGNGDLCGRCRYITNCRPEPPAPTLLVIHRFQNILLYITLAVDRTL